MALKMGGGIITELTRTINQLSRKSIYEKRLDKCQVVTIEAPNDCKIEIISYAYWGKFLWNKSLKPTAGAAA